MNAVVKKYRLGNQPEEYELKEDYLGWVPKNSDWETVCSENYPVKNMEITVVNPESKKHTLLLLHQFISKGAFPLSFFGEERSSNWARFAIVSHDKTSEKFIIPLH
jgi:hypothetical protein